VFDQPSAPKKLNMSMIKAEVCEILELKPHKNADALELATVQG
jgi:tRNA-binding EMAP/Myf-like protein